MAAECPDCGRPNVSGDYTASAECNGGEVCKTITVARLREQLEAARVGAMDDRYLLTAARAALAEAHEAIRVRDHNDNGLFMEAFKAKTELTAARAALAEEYARGWNTCLAENDVDELRAALAERDAALRQLLWIHSQECTWVECSALNAARRALSEQPPAKETPPVKCVRCDDTGIIGTDETDSGLADCPALEHSERPAKEGK